jgi:hypothetical protein
VSSAYESQHGYKQDVTVEQLKQIAADFYGSAGEGSDGYQHPNAQAATRQWESHYHPHGGKDAS